MEKSAIHSFLRQHRYAVISSLSASHTPQSALIGVAVSPNLEIIFDTFKSSRKYPDLMANSNCSLVIGWENEQTLQLEGRAHEPHGPELAHYQKIYFETWPDGPARPLARSRAPRRPPRLAALQRFPAVSRAGFRTHFSAIPPLIRVR
jgi:hypothetical protein